MGRMLSIHFSPYCTLFSYPSHSGLHNHKASRTLGTFFQSFVEILSNARQSDVRLCEDSTATYYTSLIYLVLPREILWI